MILNYRVELCRQCYYKRIRLCSQSDKYIQNLMLKPTKSGGECVHYQHVTWLPILD